MSGSTPKYGISYLTGTDAVALTDEALKAIAERVDLLLGEGGTESITPSAVDTVTTKRVNYSRTYSPMVPRVQVTINEGRSMAQDFHAWSSAEDATGFTLNIRASTTTARAVRWEARP